MDNQRTHEPTPVWHLERMGRIYDCGEDTVIYFDTRSGDTHLISLFAAFLLESLAGRSLTLQQIEAVAAEDTNPDDMEALGPAIIESLDTLVDLDIVERL